MTDDIGLLAALNSLETGGPDLVVEMVNTDEDACWIEARDGSLRVGTGTRPGAQLRLRSSTMSPLSGLCGSSRGWSTAQAIEAASGTGPWAAMCPFDVGPQPLAAERIPNADVTVQHGVFDSPVGHFRFYDVFVDGRLVERTGGVAAHPDAVVENSYERMIRSHDPELPLLDAISGARVHGRDVSALMVIAGLYESPTLRSHIGQRTRTNDLLCRLAHHTRSGPWLQRFTR